MRKRINFELKEFKDKFTEKLELKSYKILLNNDPIITLDRYQPNKDQPFFSIYWNGSEIPSKSLLNFLNSSLKKADYKQLKLIVFKPKPKPKIEGEAQRVETEAKIPLHKTPGLEETIKDATFLRVQTDYFALLADLMPTVHETPVMGIIAGTPLGTNEPFLTKLIADYFQFTNYKRVLKKRREVKKFKKYLSDIL